MSASWLKGIEQGRRLPPRLPLLVKHAEALAVGDITVLAGTDLDLGSAQAVPVASFARIPHDAVPAIREAVRAAMLTVPGASVSVEALAGRVRDAWVLWHTSPRHRTDVTAEGRLLLAPGLGTTALVPLLSLAAGRERRRWVCCCRWRQGAVAVLLSCWTRPTPFGVIAWNVRRPER